MVFLCHTEGHLLQRKKMMPSPQGITQLQQCNFFHWIIPTYKWKSHIVTPAYKHVPFSPLNYRFLENTMSYLSLPSKFLAQIFLVYLPHTRQSIWKILPNKHDFISLRPRWGYNGQRTCGLQVPEVTADLLAGSRILIWLSTVSILNYTLHLLE